MELEILENTKMLLGIEDAEADQLLQFLISDTIEAVKAHCRIVIVPNQLYGLIAQIAAEIYRSRSYGGSESLCDIKSLTEGDRRIEFDNNSACFDRYVTRLEPFINRSARLPSDLEVHDGQS